MFERRLKILLILLLIASGALALRATQNQIQDQSYWQQNAGKLMKRTEFIETTRGSILDRKGRVLACDAPCTDACVDYHVIPQDVDPDWLRTKALESLKARLGSPRVGAAKRSGELEGMLSEEEDRLLAGIDAMWRELAAVGGKTPEEIDQIRQDIVQRVETRKRYIWWRDYGIASEKSKDQRASWYRKFLGDSGQDDAAMDKFEVEVGEESMPHMILHNLSQVAQARLARQQDRFIFLTLSPSKFRDYPFGRAGCNVLGYMRAATSREIDEDAALNDSQVQRRWTALAEKYWPGADVQTYGMSKFRELRKYWQNDLVGRTGVEALCENTLRGTRGEIESVAETDRVLDRIEAVPGKNVSTSIDITLQNDIENDLLKTRVHRDKTGQVLYTRYNQHGAAVVIDVATGDVLAMASNPGFDSRELDQRFEEYSADELNHPLMNRATQLAVVPGSTVKTIVGSGSITDGTMKPTDRIQCRGVLYIDGKPQPTNHCWIYAFCKSAGLPITHGTGGANDPYIRPDDMLNVTDGLRVSCNVVFETIALRMGAARLSQWYDWFGLGRKTGIGIEETAGFVRPPTDVQSIEGKLLTASEGIGQIVVQATPLQMANVAATLARDGVWMRPRLVPDELRGRFASADGDLGPARVDLHLSPAALQAVQTGMKQVCAPDGSGEYIRPDEIERGPDDPPLSQDLLNGIDIAGKTGTAQTGGLMTIIHHDDNGKAMSVQKIPFGYPGTDGWYVPPDATTAPEKHMAHAWFIGYAPAEHPQVAFCVLVEYGEGGGRVAGPIAHDVLVDCIKHGYLSK